MSNSHNHNHFNISNIQDSNILIRFATYMSVATALVIIIIKSIAWILTDSLTILATLADSFLDIFSSLINLLAVKYAMQPPDNDHRFGHNKAEDLAVFIQSSFFMISGLFLIITAIKRFIVAEEVTNNNIGIIIMIISIIITSILIIFQKYVINKTKSHVIEADYLHYSIDLFSNVAVIISLIINKYFDIKLIDPLFALFIAAYVTYGAWKLITRSADNLMDKELCNEEKQKIHDIIIKNNSVKNVHDLKTRYGGSKAFIQFHIVLDKNISLIDAHNISNEIENDLLSIIPNAEILIHPDPEDSYEIIEYPLPI